MPRVLSSCLAVLAGLLCTVALGQAPATQPAPEFRAIWVSRFEWPNPDPAQCKAYIDRVMTNLAEHNFNAVIFQVRGQADTFYPSPEEPWSPLISPNGADPGWDPLEYAVDAAHAAGLEFHAYINTHVGWQSAAHQPPAAKNHAFYRHFNAADPQACDWLIHDAAGKPVQYAEDNYVWLAPGVPACQAYTRKQIMYVVRRYHVDGVHFDRVRTPGAEYSHDPISVARQARGSEGNPDDLDFDEWTRNQITRQLCDLYAEVMEFDPTRKVSSSPLGLYRQERYPKYPASFHYAWSKCHQDAQAWLAVGCMDFITPQIYWPDDDGKPPNYSEILPDWIAHSSGRHICPGQNLSTRPAGLMQQVRLTRASGGQGNTLFSYGRFVSQGYIEAYTRSPDGVYQQPAPLPTMEWKSRPTEGIIIGTVTDARTGEPIVDAQIRQTGSNYTALSSGDGLYSFLKVPPGTHTLTIRKRGLPEQTVDVPVIAGRVTRRNVTLGAPVVAAAMPPAASTTPASAPVATHIGIAAAPPEKTQEATATAERATVAPIAVVDASAARQGTTWCVWLVGALLVIGGTALVVTIILRASGSTTR